MRVVVTGGAGFIGANLCRALRAHDIDVVAFDNLFTGSRSNLAGADVQLIEGDVLDLDAVEAHFKHATAIVHLAARGSVPRSLADPLATHHANVTGTVNALEAARRAGVEQFIFASSSSVYGANPALPKHEGLVPEPRSPYAASNLASEAFALAYTHSFGLPVLALRLFNVFGPLQPADHAFAAVIPTFVAAALRDEALPIHGDGLQTRDFTFVGSVVELLVEALERRVVDTGPVNLAFGTRVSLLGVVGALEAILGKALRLAHQEPRAGDVRDSQADTTKLRSLFPDAQPVPLASGLEQTVRWFRESCVK